MSNDEWQEKAREAKEKKQAERVAQGLSAIMSPLEACLADPSSHKKRQKAQCYTCLGGTLEQSPDPGWQWGAGNCTDATCPNHAVRPYQHKLGKKPEGDWIDWPEKA